MVVVGEVVIKVNSVKRKRPFLHIQKWPLVLKSHQPARLFTQFGGLATGECFQHSPVALLTLFVIYYKRDSPQKSSPILGDVFLQKRPRRRAVTARHSTYRW